MSTITNVLLTSSRTAITLLASPTPLTTPPSPTQESFVFPAAGIVAIVIAAFLLIVCVFLLVRKCILYRGHECPACPRACVTCDCCVGWEGCRGLCQTLDCQTPECNACLDNICPSKPQVSTFCSALFSCYCCTVCMESCREVRWCPDCSAVSLPDCDCCNCCHCAIKIPECNQISFLCFECGRPE